jgi:Acetyltransferase (GNAT) domain
MIASQCAVPPVEIGNSVALNDSCERSSVSYVTVDPRFEPEWDSIIERHAESSVFHSSNWAHVLCRSYGHQARYLKLERGGQLAALVPLMEVSSPLTGRRGVGLPFTDFCRPLIYQEMNFDEVRDAILTEGVRRRWKHVEIRDMQSAELTSKGDVLGHTLDLAPSVAEIFARFAGSVRTAIRKAEANDVAAQIGTDCGLLREYYRLHVSTRGRHGVPPQPWSFFKNIASEFLAKKRGFVVLGSLNGRAVAGGVFLHSNRSTVYKFGASDAAGRQSNASNLVIWTAIKNSKEMGIPMMHFGRTELGNETLRRFKQRWGTSEVPMSYMKVDPRSRTNICRTNLADGLHTKVFKRCPLIVNRLLGSILYRHMD